ncbi:kinase-like protein [Lentinus tigrinus ALCF2SS1-7]|uniref:Kinase-like protein n=1 Tax=Lentinus tigrinus ALCF2SS1-6 TaxID=1328759 RepID=A0A5C2RZ57_9APHY|nr:kinase-like protein [Lentinus tigrinus ALCF2SS1-6]RPD71497.1 kinase-like protein [Lentinus tigrinus ALCF2SS1-7]
MATPSMVQPPVDFPFPQSYQDLVRMQQSNPVKVLKRDDYGYKVVMKLRPGIVLKHGGEFADEILCMRVARAAGLPVPDVLYHPGSVNIRNPWTYPPVKNVWYFCMEEMPGVSLDTVVDQLSDDKLLSLASQLRGYLDLLARVPHQGTIGSVDGGSFRTLMVSPLYQPERPFQNVAEFNNFLSSLYGQCVVPHAIFIEHTSCLPTNDTIRFTHGDLVPKNIMVDANGERITGIIDWENAGFYPSYWEYCRMHDGMAMTPGWEKILNTVFPEPKRQKEIDAVRAMLVTFDIQL